MPLRTEEDLSHKQAQVLFFHAWDAEVTAAEYARLKKHLAECPECAEAASSMRRFLIRLEEISRQPDREPE